jgi:site-specific DNA-methyltransferase (adenine-specific)
VQTAAEGCICSVTLKWVKTPATVYTDRVRTFQTAEEATGLAKIIHGDNLPALRAMPDSSVDLIYADPPFNTGRSQLRKSVRAVRDEGSERIGFGGRRYRTELLNTAVVYLDQFDDFLAFLEPRLKEAHRVLRPTGSLFFHIDYREAHYCKLLLDALFGRDHLQNEIIWAYDYGSRPKRKWPTKHETIFWYTKHPKHYTFRLEDADRIPYMAPTLVGKEKAARGKTATDVWWHTIVSPTGKEKTGYPTQKPLGILERIVKVHTNPGDMVLDMFAGSGTAAEAAARNGRDFIAIDTSKQAISVMEKRLAEWL